MIIGVPKEIKNREYRVGLTPAWVSLLKDQNHTVLVQSKAGEGIGFQDNDYSKAGAKILGTAAEIYEKAEMIVKVKEPLPEEYTFLREQQILFTFLHLAAEERLTKALLERKVIAIAYETLSLESGALPILTPMSAIAGKLSVQIGAHYLQKEQGGRGVLLGGVPGVEKGKVVIIGAGAAGLSACKMAIGLGAQVTLLDNQPQRLELAAQLFKNEIQTLFSNATEIEKWVVDADLVIGAVLIPGAKAPKIITKEMVKKMRDGSVIIDIAVDQGGSAETSRPTSHEHPTFQVEGVIHYAVPNMPSAVPFTSTKALNNVTFPYIQKIAAIGWKEAVKNDPALKRGLNIVQGKVVNQTIAQDLGFNYEPYKG